MARRGAVLVIDDDAFVGGAIRRVLSALHDVTMFESAAEALVHLRGGATYDVILCDLMMPGMNGMQLYAELKGTAPQHAARMVFLTGGAFSDEAAIFLDGVDNLRVAKPFDVQLLRELVASRVGEG